jgi:hypothetical protein
MTSTIHQASKLLVYATRHSGRHRIVDLNKSTSTTQGTISIARHVFEIQKYNFEFQKVSFHIEPNTGEVKLVQYPTSAKINDILTSAGHTDQDAYIAYNIWGLNEFEVWYNYCSYYFKSNVLAATSLNTIKSCSHVMCTDTYARVS